VEGVSGEGDRGELGGGDFDADRVVAVVAFGVDLEPGARGRAGDEVHDDLVTLEWLATPVTRDRNEEAMFNLVPLRRAGREVTHRDAQPGALTSGACHILAHQFLSLHYGEAYELIYIKHEGFVGSHMYASDGSWAFDYDGWTLESELLTEHERAYRTADPHWTYDRVVVSEGLPEFLKHTNDLRPPEYFPELPWRRAYDYIKTFEAHPPDRGSD
jgi:hypothetical protein